ncbi:hypothetical protein AAMO2058_001708600 [Amorphochlora amoebiformis]|mmetsp:Transcript_27283/g.43303  ORF Transcript_27283/g.43303 Transcript_27283/m.43303 type:complete len:186 (-) Transcript_27283:214-771(-)
MNNRFIAYVAGIVAVISIFHASVSSPRSLRVAVRVPTPSISVPGLMNRGMNKMCASPRDHLTCTTRRQVKVRNFLDNMFAPKAPGGSADTSPYICIDCGYIYKKKSPSFKELPSSYVCPACGVGKNRFKVYKDDSPADYYNTLAAQKAANRKARAGPSSKRAELIRKQQEMQKKKDEEKGRKGWF